jgi:hypothetical protein
MPEGFYQLVSAISGLSGMTPTNVGIAIVDPAATSGGICFCIDDEYVYN